MSAEVWYRKWRPQTFADVVGQAHVTRTLARAVALDRVAHAYLFCGPRGTGKTSTARILAKAVNCQAPVAGQPCLSCASCEAVAAGRALDLVEMDAASNRGIDDVRRIRDTVGYSPNSSQYKVYLIDEVHELTAIAFDALLKTLEEPPPHVIFVLATTERHKVPETILSRCQVFDFVRIKLADTVARLRQIADAEGVETTDAALSVIARRATGSLRDGANLFEQAVATHGHALTEDLVRADGGGSGDARARTLVGSLLSRQLAEALDLIAAVRDDGIDLRQFAREAVQTLRAAMLLRAGASASLDLGEEALTSLQELAGGASAAELVRLLRLLTAVDFRADPQSPLPLELAVVEALTVAAPEPAAVAAPIAARGWAAESPPAAPTAPSSAERARAVTAPRTGPRPEPIPLRRPATPPESAPPATGENGGARSVAAEPADREPPPALVTPIRAEPVAVVATEAASAEAPVAARGAEAADSERSVAASAEIGLDEARRRFREIYTRLSALDRTAAALLNSGCDIVSVEGQAIVFGFQFPALTDRALRNEPLAALRRAVSETLGRELTVMCKHVPDVANRMLLLASERPSHLLDEALKLGAKPIERA